jgi:NADPH-dependent 2,4-dienoyl-CoA reductase/sulfur reductase-like enzyme
MTNRDIVVVGGSAAGLTAALTAARHYPDKQTTVVRREDRVLVPCGIPYIFGTLKSVEKNVMPDAPYEANGIELLKADVTELDPAAKLLHTSGGDVTYDRLILATGSLPIMPPIPGFDLEGVFPIQKDFDYLEQLFEKLEQARDVVIIGGGFIGVEFADEINKMGKARITIVEVMPHCLSLAYDDEFCVEMEDLITARGIEIKTSVKVESIQGQGRVQSVRLSDGSEVKADAVILGIGARPMVELAERAGLRIGLTGAIAVETTMRTSEPNIFACGDCAEKVSFFGGRPSGLKLASIAQTEARIAAANLFGITREHCGTIGVWSTRVGDLALGTAGLTETMARQSGYDIVTAVIDGPDRHPGGMPDMSKLKMKAVFEANSGVLLGAQVRGGPAAGELINAVSACIQNRMNAEEIATFQIGTHPALTPSPVVYPLVNLAEMAIKQRRQRG